ncbi:MAG: 4Fe-4S dicluster domain-containing protein [Holophagales bacterium]|nr:4Fe-4S dicluster domain-containing protein [Holophagales bacterium]MYD22290.1 4Fe-4S dicluster domain-containing protein [Holophagales bacterium]MYI34170.1 4Fe-4S dicluster domain-containing protein [Holophagales bacterium]
MSAGNGNRPERTYWRSLEQLQGDSGPVAVLEREFPEGASEAPPELLQDGVSRRSALAMLGGTASLAGLTGCDIIRRPVEHIVPYVDAPEGMVPGVPLAYATTMPFGSRALGLLVESHEGRPTKVEGNELHPFSDGASSVWAQASMLDLYDPDRSKSVRFGNEASSWEDFVAAWTEGDLGPAADGTGFAILAEPSSSPTLVRLKEALLDRYPQAHWVTWEPVSEENADQGTALAAGEHVHALYHVDRAQVLLTLDSDFLSTEGDSVRNLRGYSRARRVNEEGGGSPLRHYAVDGVHSVTAANADHRLRVQSGRVAAFLARLGGALAGHGLELPLDAGAPAGDIDDAWVDALARDLIAHRGAGLIVAGNRQPAAVHAAVYALNSALGNAGSTVTYHRTPDTGTSSDADLAALAAAIHEGAVDRLLVLGANPAYSAPADLDLPAALESLGNAGAVIHVGAYRDETSRFARWHVPLAHYLESWSDARATDGTASVVQPLIEPLYGAKSLVEVVALAALGESRDGRDLVRETWAGILGLPLEEAADEAAAAGAPPEAEAEAAAAADGEGEEAEAEEAVPVDPMSLPFPVALSEFEVAWRKVLHDGLLDGSAAPAADLPAIAAEDGAAALRAAGDAAQAIAASDDLEIVFRCSPAVHDGRFANNGWLQELPDAMTKLTWDNAALISPATANALGLENEDLVTVASGGRELELPVWQVPGQADNTVTLDLGYGRDFPGRIASAANAEGRAPGRNVYLLRGSEAPDLARGTLSPTGGTYPLAQTQDHHSMEGRPIVREADLDYFETHPDFATAHSEKPHENSMWDEWTYQDSPQWGMTIDLNACVGCNACMIACQSENNVPIVGKEQVMEGREMHWLRIDRYFSDEGEPASMLQELVHDLPSDPQTSFQPVPCMQCENAPCEQVCPVAATVHDSEGLNAMVYNRCIGTRYCSNNCPYKVRRFNYFNFTKDTPEVMKLGKNPDVTIRSRGVMEKCTYCVQRISRAKVDARQDGRGLADGDVVTACQQACPAEAIRFGDITDAASGVSEAKASPRNYKLLDDLHTKPRTTYLAKIRHPNREITPAPPPAEDHDGGEDAGHGEDAH